MRESERERERERERESGVSGRSGVRRGVAECSWTQRGAAGRSGAQRGVAGCSAASGGAGRSVALRAIALHCGAQRCTPQRYVALHGAAHARACWPGRRPRQEQHTRSASGRPRTQGVTPLGVALSVPSVWLYLVVISFCKAHDHPLRGAVHDIMYRRVHRSHAAKKPAKRGREGRNSKAGAAAVARVW